MTENTREYTVKDIVDLSSDISIEELRKVYRGFFLSKSKNFDELDEFSENELKHDIAFEMLKYYFNDRTKIPTEKELNKILDFYKEIIEKLDNYNNRSALINNISNMIYYCVKEDKLSEIKNNIINILDLIKKDYKNFSYDTIYTGFNYLLGDDILKDKEIKNKIKEFMKDLEEKHEEEKNNVINNILKLTNNSTLEELQETYKTIEEYNRHYNTDTSKLSQNELKYAIVEKMEQFIEKKYNKEYQTLNNNINKKQIELIKEIFQNSNELNINNLPHYYVFDFIKILQNDITGNHEDTISKIIDFIVKNLEQFSYNKVKDLISYSIEMFTDKNSEENQEIINKLKKQLTELENIKKNMISDILKDIKDNPNIDWEKLNKKITFLIKDSGFRIKAINTEEYQYLYNLSFLDIENEEYPNIIVNVIKQDLENPNKSNDVCDFLNNVFIKRLINNNTKTNRQILLNIFDLMMENLERFSYNKVKKLISDSIEMFTDKNLEENQEIINKLKEKQQKLEDYKNTEIDKIYNYINSDLSIENLRKSCKILNCLRGLDPKCIDSKNLVEYNLIFILINDLVKYDKDNKRVSDMCYKLFEYLFQNTKVININDLNDKVYNYLSHIPLDTQESINKAKEIFNSIDLTKVGNKLNNCIELQHYILRKEQELYGINIQENNENTENNIEEGILNAVINQSREEGRQRAQDNLYTLDNIEKNISKDQTIESFIDSLKTEDGRKYLIDSLFVKHFADSFIGSLSEEEQKEVEEFIKLSKKYFLDENNKNIHDQIVNLISYGSDAVGKYIENIMIGRMSNNLSNIGKIIDIINAGNDLNKIKEKSVSTMFKKLVVATLKRKEINEQEINKENNEIKEMKEITKNMQKQSKDMIKNKLRQHKIKKEKKMNSPITTNEILEQQFTDLSFINNDLSETVVVQTTNSFANNINNDYDALIDEFNEEMKEEISSRSVSPDFM